MKQEQTNKTIPFGKPALIGNFKVWRSRTVVGKGRNKSDLECINISNVDGSWFVRIPATFEMFGMITVAFAWYNGENEEEKKRGEDFLQSSLSNMMYVSCICNGFYHHGVQMLTNVYANPDLLRDKKKFKALKKETEGCIERFLLWREEYERQMKIEPTEKEQQQEEFAEQAAEIISNK